MFVLFDRELINMDHVVRIYIETIYETDEDDKIIKNEEGLKEVSEYFLNLVFSKKVFRKKIKDRDQYVEQICEWFDCDEREQLLRRFNELEELLCK